MKRLLNMLSFSIRPLAAVLLIALVFSACNKKDDTIYPASPVAGLMAFNLAPDQSNVGFSLSGNQFGTAALGYTSYTGAYLPVRTGNREVRSTDLFSGSTLAISNNNFRDSMYYSAFLLGTGGNYRNVVVDDHLTTLTVAPGKAWVRYINAIPDSTAAVAISVGSDSPVAAPYATVSAFMQVNAGTVNTAISNGSTISASRSIAMEENKAYTLLFVGQPGAADPVNAVQIKFITNGTVTP